jgi:predicted transposase YdaD
MVGDQRYREILEEMNLNNTEESNMCEVFDKIEQRGIQKGIQEEVISLYKKGLISLSDAIKELSVSEEEFLKMTENNLKID